jgi:hypothetical protein
MPYHIQAFFDRGVVDCFTALHGPDLGAMGCMPYVLGTDTRNDQRVGVLLTPDGKPVIRYVGVSDDDCCEAGGKKLDDGCVPPEAPYGGGCPRAAIAAVAKPKPRADPVVEPDPL